MNAAVRRAARLLAAAPLLLVLGPLFSSPRATGGQDLGNLLSPGRLSKAHAKLEGLDNCQKCHEPGRKVTAEKCLACHAPIAERIAAKKGVHRDVKGDCVSCHVEHAGVDAELRPFDTKKFDHAAETGFALDGKHAPLAANCQSCHKTRSFLTLKPACASCHADKHKGRMGPDCASCHTTAVAFKEAAKTFDHSKAAFPLTGAHATVACANCHKTPDFRVAKFGACNDCHRDPHVKPLGDLRVVPHDGELQGDAADRPRQDGFPAGRQARPGSLRDVPRPAADEGAPEGRQVRRLPPGPPQGRLQGRGLRVLPQGDRLQAGGAVRSRAEDGLRARRKPRDRSVRVLPQGRGGSGGRERREGHGGLPRGEEGLRELPPRSAQGRARRALRELPHRQVVPGGVLPAPEVPGVLPGQARDRAVRVLSPSARLPRDRTAGPALQGPLDRMRHVPQGPAPRPARNDAARAATRSGPGRSRATSTRGRTSRRFSRRSTGRSPASSATRLGRRRSRPAPARPSSSRASPRSARAVTRTPTTGCSASSARPATRSRPGRRRRALSTRTRSSRWKASTSRRRARPVTSTASSRGRPTAATTATGSAARTTSTRRGSETNAGTATGRSAGTP